MSSFAKRLSALSVIGVTITFAFACDGGGVTSTVEDVVTVDVAPTNEAVPIGGTKTFEAFPKDDAGRVVPNVQVTWSVSDESIARIDAQGVATGMAIGTSTVSARANGVIGSAFLTVVQRSSTDRPDQISGPQIHFLYVISQDGEDRSLDLDGTVLNSVGSVQTWLSRETGGRTLRLDTYEGILDEAFLQLARTDAEIVASGDQAVQVIRGDVQAAGFDDPEKLYVVYYDGVVDPSLFCTVRQVDIPRMVFFLLQECNLGFADSPVAAMKNAEAVLMHDILHVLGFVASGAPHRESGSHVNDDSRDLLFFGHQYQFPDSLLLDFGRDDYYGENVPEGVLNFADSPYLN